MKKLNLYRFSFIEDIGFTTKLRNKEIEAHTLKEAVIFLKKEFKVLEIKHQKLKIDNTVQQQKLF